MKYLLKHSNYSVLTPNYLVMLLSVSVSVILHFDNTFASQQVFIESPAGYITFFNTYQLF